MNKKTMKKLHKSLHKSLIFRIFDTLKAFSVQRSAFSVQRSAFSVQRKFTDKQPKKYKNPLWRGTTFSEVDFLCLDLDEIRANCSIGNQQSAIGILSNFKSQTSNFKLDERSGKI